jgi:excisionase family DNA binding protein
MYKSYDELPLMLSVHDVAEVLGISKSSAYVLVKEKGFPKQKIGARVVVPREKFIEWINKNTSK